MHHHIHTHKHECRQEIYTTIPTESFCLDKSKQSHTKSRQNNLHSVHAGPCRIYLDLKIHNNALPMVTHPKVLGLTLDPKLTYSTHLHTISVHAHKPLQIIKACFTTTGWGKQKETRMDTYKAVMRPAQGLPNCLPGTTTLMCQATSNCIGKAHRATESL